MKTKINAEIVAHSINGQGDELISVLATFPRIILAEVNTHRMLSKNTSSSRAIPFNKMVETIQNDPFIPIAWQKEHKGMQGSEYFGSELFETHKPSNWRQPIDAEEDETYVEVLTAEWLMYRDSVVEDALRLNSLGVTKQLCNRLLEPFMWTTMLITGPKSGWENFFKLRCPDYTFNNDEDDFHFRSKKDAIAHFGAEELVEYPTGNISIAMLSDLQWRGINYGAAEIHIMELAEIIWDNLNDSDPKLLKPGEWHIPFESQIKEPLIWKLLPEGLPQPEWAKLFWETKVKVSVAMAARTSYTVVGNEKEIDVDAMVALHDRLLAQDPPHSSPFEHTCQAVSKEEYKNSFKGQEKGWFRNYKGFKSYRQIVEELK